MANQRIPLGPEPKAERSFQKGTGMATKPRKIFDFARIMWDLEKKWGFFCTLEAHQLKK